MLHCNKNLQIIDLNQAIMLALAVTLRYHTINNKKAAPGLGNRLFMKGW